MNKIEFEARLIELVNEYTDSSFGNIMIQRLQIDCDISREPWIHIDGKYYEHSIKAPSAKPEEQL